MTGSPNEDSNAITKSRLPKVTVSAIFYNNRNAQKGHAHAKGQQGDRTIESAVVHIARNILSGLKRSDNFIPVVEQVTEYFQEMADPTRAPIGRLYWTVSKKPEHQLLLSFIIC